MSVFICGFFRSFSPRMTCALRLVLLAAALYHRPARCWPPTPPRTPTGADRAAIAVGSSCWPSGSSSSPGSARADWINRDGQAMKLDLLRWNPMVFGSFLGGVMLFFLIPCFLARLSAAVDRLRGAFGLLRALSQRPRPRQREGVHAGPLALAGGAIGWGWWESRSPRSGGTRRRPAPR